ncbi:hypothetical protein [Bifidobacterium felsineum]|uniref:hypothetical protein n=1 Tax=Bifidobacterium felsineum TaxID=2045440 RepID=UPI001BDC1D3A|nr:hypothetical protein [Bifidobacterium felsineum]MBT1164663.1 hypothetical protein [Bifidobacterium felsineum]
MSRTTKDMTRHALENKARKAGYEDVDAYALSLPARLRPNPPKSHDVRRCDWCEGNRTHAARRDGQLTRGEREELIDTAVHVHVNEIKEE